MTSDMTRRAESRNRPRRRPPGGVAAADRRFARPGAAAGSGCPGHGHRACVALPVDASVNLLASRHVDSTIKDYYSADAGVEWALWHLKSNPAPHG